MELFFFVLQSTKKWRGEPRSRMEDREGGNRRGEEGGRKTDPSLYLLLPKTLFFFFFSLSLAFHLEPAEGAVR